MDMKIINKFCCICLCNGQDLLHLFDTVSHDITYYVKLTQSIPEMCFNEMNDQRWLCKECCDTIDIVYKFREKCLKSKTQLIAYLSYLRSSSGGTNDEADVSESNNDIEAVFIKTEREFNEIDEENYNFNELNNIINKNDMTDNCCSDIKLEIKTNIEVKTEYTNQNIVENLKGISNDSLETRNETNRNESKNKENIDEIGERKDHCMTDIDILTLHMQSHTASKLYECNICDKKYSQGHSLTRHMRIHTGEKKFECNICNMAFVYSHSLTRHIKLHSGIKPHECNVCSKRFLQISDLSRHMRFHTGEKPHACVICNKRFSLSSSLTVHMRIHTGEKTYECDICDKKFARLGDRSRHMKFHSGNKPHACVLCSKRFVLLGDLTRHMRTHARKNI